MDRKFLLGATFIAAIAALLLTPHSMTSASDKPGALIFEQDLSSTADVTSVAGISSPESPNTGLPCNSLCIVPDNGLGTADLPASCSYVALLGGMHIVDGLPPGSTIEVDPVLTGFGGIVRTPGGVLGGEILQFNASLLVQLQGTGALLGFSRNINIPVTVEIHNGPRIPATSPQSFPSELRKIQGQIIGDPDFDLLRITGGNDFGLPSPGHTTLTQQPGGGWAVDSFFDITYRIDFVGRPGGSLSGMSGSTTGECTLSQGFHYWVPADGHKMHFPQLPDPSGWDVYGVAPMVLGDDWQCSQTGPVEDIHFWGSWLDDNVGVITSFDISIREDIPAGITTPYSHPGSLLWQRTVTDFCILPISPPTTEGWYDPFTGVVLANNHLQYFQYDVYLDTVDWFVQNSGTIYWLCITANVSTPGTAWGWKSSLNHFNDDAVWQQLIPSTCVMPDNGGGTADLPALCSYLNTSGTYDIIDGLPPGTEINSQGDLGGFFNITRSPGGTLGGEVDQFMGVMSLQMTGTGSLVGFNRVANLPISNCQFDHAPRTPGTPLQSFASDLFVMQGQIIGDPDFDLLRITAGTGFGMPSPGHTTLTQLPGGQWNVDSFFDITYRIDFVGAPGGPLAGRSGSTTGTIRIQQGGPVTGGGLWNELFEPPAFVNSMDLAFVITGGSGICDCMPGDANGTGTLTISDAVHLINYIFAGGPAPTPYPLCSGDANCDCVVSISDAVYMINYIFAGGPAPCDCTQWLVNCGPPLR